MAGMPADSLGNLRSTARTALLIGAVTSVVCMWTSGHNNDAIIVLMLMFAAWVASPFAALAVADMLSGNWSEGAQTTLYRLMISVSVASMAVYGYVSTHPRPQVAAPFLMTPLATWLAIAVGTMLFRRRTS